MVRQAEQKPVKKWEFELSKERNVLVRRPVFVGTSVLHCLVYDKKGFSESLLLCFDVESGTEIWRFTEPHVFNEPVKNSQGDIFLSSYSGIVRAFKSDGTLMWHRRVLDGPRCNLGQAELVGQDRLVVAEIHGQARNTWCLSQSTGELLWQFENGGHSYGLASDGAVVAHCTAVGGMYEQSVRTFALDSRSGLMVWCADGPHWMFDVQIVDDVVLVGGRGCLRGHAIGSGSLVAHHALADEMEISGKWIQRNLTSIFACSKSPSLVAIELFRRDAPGLEEGEFLVRWEFDLGQPVVGQPVACGDQAYAMLENAGLQTFDLASGSLGSLYQLGKRVSAFAINGSYVAVAHGRNLAVWELPGNQLLMPA